MKKTKSFLIIFFLISLAFTSCKDQKDYSAKKQDNHWVFYAKGESVAKMGQSAPPGIEVIDKISHDSAGIFKVERIFQNNTEETLAIERLVLDVEGMQKPSWLMIPSISYNGNHWGKGNEPKDFSGIRFHGHFQLYVLLYPGLHIQKMKNIALLFSPATENRQIIFPAA